MVYAALTWIFVVACVTAVFVAYGIGANDLANSFGSSVGAGALSMKQAILIGAICEFGGAVLMGSGVSATISNQIADVSAFTEKPDVFAYGMLCSLAASGMWLILATYWEMPVSTTHSIVGAIVGMTVVTAGPEAVNWSEHTDSFPFLGGMSSIILSWLFSPILTALLSASLFALLRCLVLRSPNAYHRAYYVLPFFVFLTFFMISLFIIQQGGGRWHWSDTPLGKACWISACVGAGCTLLSIALQALLIRRRVTQDLRQRAAAVQARKAAEQVAAAAAQLDREPGVQLEGAHDDLIADVIGSGDPLAFGFSADGLELDLASSRTLGSGEVPALQPLPTDQAAPGSSGGGGSDGSLGARASAGGGDVEAGYGGNEAGSGGSGSRQQQPAANGKAASAAAAAGIAAARAPAALAKFQQSQMWSVLSHGANFDIHEVVETDEHIHALHYHSERFDWRAERVFKFLQVFSGCANSFAHGSNDVSNAIGPFVAIYSVWTTFAVSAKVDVPVWTLVMGGGGIAMGLATYGYKIMRVLGVKMTRLTNSRGFIVEISSAAIVVISSRLGLPISTTHCLVGAVAGIGLLEGRRGFNWLLLFRFLLGWVATLVVSALAAAALTAQGVYSPSNNAAAQRTDMAAYLENSTAAISALLAGSGMAANAAASAALNASLASLPDPLISLQLGTDVQQQALLDYYRATSWTSNGTTAR
ncbi:hypothetical protein D9Q98_005487 [Chlorella vulgaris]|uniref:Phosphate transporter n=1 Tax=Chlorella vulgaris TaxID=3077 RepID=A0A9D4TMB7_CHLVU|nr:hypothetical protein D9Q98_005487 [Chlorella vulgaris]